MKIRISGNSIRFRLKQTDVAIFREAAMIQEVISFGPQPSDKLSFVLKAFHSTDFELTWAPNMVVVKIPEKVWAEWTNTDLVGFDKDISTGNGEVINVLIEKDFKCIDGNEADNEDAYPNPDLHC